MSSKITGFRRVAMLGVTAVVAVTWLGVAPVRAQTETTTTAPGETTTPPTEPQLKPNEIFNGVTVGPGTVTTPGSPSRTLSANQTAAFMITWLPASVFQNLPNETPDKCLTRSTLRFDNTFKGVATPTVVYYASDGTNAWVGMPAQSLGFASVPEEKWIAAPDAKGTIAAFNAPGDPPSTTNKCTTTAQPPEPAADDSSDSPTWLFIAVPAAIVVGVGIWLLLRSRSRARVA